MYTENQPSTPFNMQNLQGGAPTGQAPQQAPQTPPPSQVPPTPREHRSIGPIIGTLIIVIVLIIGALYVWGQKLNNEAQEQQTEETINTQGAAAAATEDDSAALDAELESSLDGLEGANF